MDLVSGSTRIFQSPVAHEDAASLPATPLDVEDERHTTPLDVEDERHTTPLDVEDERHIARMLTRHAADITFVFDLDTHTCVYSSRGIAASLLGYAPDDEPARQPGLLPSLIHPQDLPRIAAHLGQFAARADDEVVEVEYRARHADGGWRWVRSREVVFKRHPSGAPRQILGTVQDIHARREAEDAVRQSEARLAEAQQVARLGSWEVDVAGGNTFWSEEMLRLFGFDPQDGNPGIAAILGRYHPEDRVRHDQVTQEAVAARRAFALDLRIVHPGGAVRWCHAMGQPVVDDAGTLRRVVGTALDITERKQAEERFEVLFKHSSEAHMLVVDNGVIDCNNAAVKLFRAGDKAQIIGLHPSVLSPPFQPDGRASGEGARETDALAHAQGWHHFEWMHRALDGALVPAEVTLTPVELDGKPALLAVCHDLSERKAAEQKIKDYSIVLEYKMAELEAANARLEALATIDGLTGVKNHRAFQERLGEEFARSRRGATPLSVVMLDVDLFKQYNDQFGHPAGDDVLRQVAQVLGATARETDFVGRYGGEEFVAILPGTDENGARRMAERCRAAMMAAQWPHCPITVSLGVASLSGGTADAAALIAQADQALYAAKAAGRNCVASAPLSFAPRAVAA